MTMTGKRIRRQKQFAGYLEGNSLDQVLNEILDSKKEEKRNQERLRERPIIQEVKAPKRKRGRPRKNLTIQEVDRKANTPISMFTSLVELPQSQAVAKIPKLKYLQLEGTLLKGVDNWTMQLGEQLNDLGIGYSNTTSPMIVQATLLPAMISESSGIVFNTQMIGARNEKGEITIPKEFQLPTLNPNLKKNRPPKISLSPRIREISDQEAEMQNKNLARANKLQNERDFPAQMIDLEVDQSQREGPSSSFPHYNINEENEVPPLQTA